jgi:pyrroloquinoline quinone biosynthesis protein B
MRPVIIVVVLGTAQDGGVPHLGCHQPRCERARREPAFARRVASLGVIDSEAQKSYLIDATPDVRPQLDALTGHRLAPAQTNRNPVDGLILTHAHIGHYTGLVQFGKEVMATRHLPTYCTPAMGNFLSANGPWSQLLRDSHLALHVVHDQESVHLTEHMTIRAFVVPHRQEWSDTIGLELTGPSKRLIYIPDIDRWSDWLFDVRAVVSACDIALLDGCFHDGGELPGRSMADVPHPLMTDSMERLDGVRTQVFFTHLNHTNPALDGDSPQRRALDARGFGVAGDGMEFVL